MRLPQRFGSQMIGQRRAVVPSGRHPEPNEWENPHRPGAAGFQLVYILAIHARCYTECVITNNRRGSVVTQTDSRLSVRLPMSLHKRISQPQFQQGIPTKADVVLDVPGNAPLCFIE